MPEKIEEQINFKVSETFANKLRKDAGEADVNLSTWLRAAVAAGSDFLLRNPDLISYFNDKYASNGKQ